MSKHMKMLKEERKKLIFDYLKGLKNPVNAWHLAEKFDITTKRVDQLMSELAADDLVVKTKGINHNNTSAVPNKPLTAKMSGRSRSFDRTKSV